MARIVAVGYTAGEFLPDQPLVHSFPDTLTRDDLGRLVDVVVGDLDEQTAVIAIYPAWHADITLRRLQTVRAAIDSAQVVLYASALPPLGGSVLCALAAAVAPYVVSPGILVAGLPLLERQLLPIARLRSVARLDHPAPSIGQHIVSWWPPSTFGVSWWPEPNIRRLRRRDPSISLPTDAGWANLPLDRLAVAGIQADMGAWVHDSVASPLGIREVLGAEPESLAGRYWGVSRYWGVNSVLEAVAYPSNVGGLVSGLGYRQRAKLCRWCGELVVSAECPFCGVGRALIRTGDAG